ncbi:uncharacterized protein GIQ15_06793 [Arthroderma uncinatum]|uniref:uncharacterized protein n=1 Tax=Arthroderma uncinatum TaxID=74035 RepID=UPI00144A93CB|nr:uncharacterized protein GIQ15_06793 [Arthroderma uncinatum]KAF3479817.1 hypothetical protein GIQ15_06793 [Arthroderma uncinatum]
MAKIVWDDAADAKLLFAIITTSVTKIDFPAVAKVMGNECTTNAIHKRLARIKSKMTPSDGDVSSAPTTPIKPKRGRPPKKSAEGDESGLDANDDAKPAKKVKRGGKTMSEDSD